MVGLGYVGLPLALAFGVTLGSVASPIGNPQNLLIGQTLHLSFALYRMTAAVPVVLGLVVTWGIIAAQARGRWTRRAGSLPAVEAESPAPVPLDVWQSTKGLAVAAALFAAFIFAPWPRDLMALAGAGLLLTSRRLAAERNELRIVDDQTGSPTWSRAIADGTVRVLERCWGGTRPDLDGAGGLYHMTASGSTTWCGFARAILKQTGRTDVKVKGIPTIDYPTPATRPARSVLNNAKFRRSFGFTLPSWRDQLHACLASEDGGS